MDDERKVIEKGEDYDEVMLGLDLKTQEAKNWLKRMGYIVLTEEEYNKQGTNFMIATIAVSIGCIIITYIVTAKIVVVV